MANAHQLDYGEQDTNIEDDNMGVDDTCPPDDEAQTLHAFLASHGKMPHPLTIRPQVQNALQTSLVKPTPTLPTVWASTELTNPVPSLIKAQMVV